MLQSQDEKSIIFLPRSRNSCVPLLLDGGAKANTIGGTGAGERNTISGNLFEGITISGAGTDGNVILGNIIGAAAVVAASSRQVSSRGDDDMALASRSQLGNGNAGVFLSKGTQGTQVGGASDADANLIAHNGGSGVEVRTTDSKRNSSKGNRISRNVKGGIALFDGSNSGIQQPTFTSVERLGESKSRARIFLASTNHFAGNRPREWRRSTTTAMSGQTLRVSVATS